MASTASQKGAAEGPSSGSDIPPSGLLAELGDFTGFVADALLELRGVLPYMGEILRQCGILITGSALVLLGVALVAGGECGLFGDYALQGLGAQSYVGFFTSLCDVREFMPEVFAWVLAAKVGCGLVAEIGSMRISDELAAMESLGVAPMRFVVGTRLVAIWLVVPLIYIVALLVASVGSYLVVTVQIGNVTGAAFGAVNWGTQTVTDNVESVIKVFVMATVVALVGCYYGYRARGGAVGVGAATARSMMANLILVSVLNAIGDAAVFTRARVPIGG